MPRIIICKADKPSPNAAVGIAFTKKGGAFIVKRIAPTSIFASSPLQVGHEIVSINDINVYRMKSDQGCAILGSIQKTITLEIRLDDHNAAANTASHYFAPSAPSDEHDNRNTPNVPLEPSLGVQLSLLPPPERPSIQMAVTVKDRYHALQKYIHDLERLCDQYWLTIEKNVAHIMHEFDEARDKHKGRAQRLGQLWLHDSLRLIEAAQEEMRFKHELVQQQLAALTRTPTKKTNSKKKKKMNNSKKKKKGAGTGADADADAAGPSFLNDFVVPLDKDDYGDEVPHQLHCPISLDLMTEPVVASDGNTYEHKALESWITSSKKQAKDGKARSPLTGEILPSTDFFHVHTLKALCQQFARQRDEGATRIPVN